MMSFPSPPSASGRRPALFAKESSPFPLETTRPVSQGAGIGVVDPFAWTWYTSPPLVGSRLMFTTSAASLPET